MKKIILPIFLFCLIFSNLQTNAQAVRDRGIIPVAVNLNLVLRLNIIDGGNIEFVFNSINDYSVGMGAQAAVLGTGANAAAARVGIGVGTTPLAANLMYRTRFTVSASRTWLLTYGAEQPTFMGTDLPTNTLPLNNVGLTMVSAGLNFNAATGLNSVPTANFTSATTAPFSLTQFPTVLITGIAGVSNSGGELDNEYVLFWQCGTANATGVTAMNAVSLLAAGTSPAADRYVTNVLFELDAL